MKRKKRTFKSDRHRRQTQVQLVIAGLLVLLVVGGGLVWLIYGPAAAVTAVACLLVVFGLFGFLWLLLTLLEQWVKEDEP